MNASQSRRLLAAEQRLAAERSAPSSGVLLGWLASDESRAALELAAAGEVYTAPDEVRRAGRQVVAGMKRRLAGLEGMTDEQIADLAATMTRAELAALIASAAKAP